ncbi:hypothetical protein [Salsuginibacillus kocurii]|uniref:hypothetical protein n=1 Tax=Salsuginibacillus kocurii TaxID=427078 RepID=UPI00037E41C5|nr:hypothetical protein [Salsuginibacillus kocurii]
MDTQGLGAVVSKIQSQDVSGMKRAMDTTEQQQHHFLDQMNESQEEQIRALEQVAEPDKGNFINTRI